MKIDRPKDIHPSLWVQDNNLNIGKGHQLEIITVMQRELKKLEVKR